MRTWWWWTPSFLPCLSGKHCLPSILNDSFVGKSNLDCRSLLFITLNTIFCGKIFLLLFNYSCPYFLSYYFPRATLPISYIQSSIAPLSLSLGLLHMFFDNRSHSLCCYLPSPSPVITICLFFISMSLVLFSSFVCLVWLSSTYRWDHMIFVFHHLAYWLSIILSSSIYVAVKGRNSFFFSFFWVVFHFVNVLEPFDPLILTWNLQVKR